MSINYNAIVGNKSKVTLPSVEAWGTNNNILRDPPKSIMTRRIDKVNQDGAINDMMYDSGDRFAEAINVYARGVNPMVSVSYGNANGAPVKQPYRIIRDNAFRPPILTQEQMLPLSRQPRNNTKVITNKAFTDYSQRVTCPAPDSGRYFKEQPINPIVIPNKYMKISVPTEERFSQNHFKEQPLKSTIIPNKSLKISTPIKEGFITGHFRDETLKATVIANKSMNISSEAKDGFTTGHFREQVLKATVIPNKSVKIEVPVENHFVVNYVNDNPITTSALTNPNALGNIQLENQTPNGQVLDEMLQFIQPINPRGIEKQNYIHDDIQLNRTMPMTSAMSQKTANINVVSGPDTELQLSRTMPMTSAMSHKTSNINVVSGPDNELQLSRTMPMTSAMSHKTANINVVNEPDTELQLSRNIPEYKVISNGKSNVTRLADDHNTNYKLSSKIIATSVITNKTDVNGTTEFTRDVKLAPSLNQGGYMGSQGIPLTGRTMQYNPNYTTGKTRIAQRVKQMAH
jgi:hypothetical protein